MKTQNPTVGHICRAPGRDITIRKKDLWPEAVTPTKRQFVEKALEQGCRISENVQSPVRVYVLPERQLFVIVICQKEMVY